MAQASEASVQTPPPFGSQTPGPPRPRRLAKLIAAALVAGVFAVFAAVLWYAWRESSMLLAGEPPLVKAPEGPWKVPPEEPGGAPIVNEATPIARVLEGRGEERPVRLLQPEMPTPQVLERLRARRQERTEEPTPEPTATPAAGPDAGATVISVEPRTAADTATAVAEPHHALEPDVRDAPTAGVAARTSAPEDGPAMLLRRNADAALTGGAEEAPKATAAAAGEQAMAGSAKSPQGAAPSHPAAVAGEGETAMSRLLAATPSDPTASAAIAAPDRTEDGPAAAAWEEAEAEDFAAEQVRIAQRSANAGPGATGALDGPTNAHPPAERDAPPATKEATVERGSASARSEETEAAARPIRTAARTPAGSPPAGPVWRVQLGAYSSEQGALSAFAELRRRFADLIGDARPVLVPVKVNGRTLERLQFGAFADRAEAERVCAAIRARGGECLVTGAGG